MYAAYDALSDGLKATLEGLRARAFEPACLRRRGDARRGDLNGRPLRNPEQAAQDAVHPVVIRHPLTGRKALYVNPGFTLASRAGPTRKSRPLLDYLYRHAARPEFTCRFQWQEGSLAFWDNRATWHFAANDYQGERRLMHRVTIEGCAAALSAFPGRRWVGPAAVFSVPGASGPRPDARPRGCGPSCPGRKIPRQRSAIAYRDGLLAPPDLSDSAVAPAGFRGH